MKTVLLSLLLGASLALAGCSSKNEGAAGTGDDTAGAEATQPGSTSADGKRRVAVDVSGKGYTPSEIQAEPGESLILVFTRSSDVKCGEYVKVAGGEAVELPLDQAVEIPVEVPATGEVQFACGMDMMTGVIKARPQG